MSHNENFDALMKTVHKWEVNDYDNLKIKTIDKYRIISLFVPQEYRDKVMKSQKNYKSLCKDNMSYLSIEAFVRLFLSICKINTQPLAEHPDLRAQMSPGVFRRLIEGTGEDIEELYEQIDNLKSKNLKGYISIEDHHQELGKMAEEVRDMAYKEMEDKYKKKLEEQEKYYKEKLSKQSKRYSEGQQYLTKEVDKLSKEVIEY